MAKAAVTPAGKGDINLMLGNVTCMTMLAGKDTGDQLSAVDVRCPQGTGPGPHTDPWRESFYVLEGEFEFQLERDGVLQPMPARPGDGERRASLVRSRSARHFCRPLSRSLFSRT